LSSSTSTSPPPPHALPLCRYHREYLASLCLTRALPVFFTRHLLFALTLPVKPCPLIDILPSGCSHFDTTTASTRPATNSGCGIRQQLAYLRALRLPLPRCVGDHHDIDLAQQQRSGLRYAPTCSCPLYLPHPEGKRSLDIGAGAAVLYLPRVCVDFAALLFFFLFSQHPVFYPPHSTICTSSFSFALSLTIPSLW
jgi:hypothetical protein